MADDESVTLKHGVILFVSEILSNANRVNHARHHARQRKLGQQQRKRTSAAANAMDEDNVDNDDDDDDVDDDVDDDAANVRAANAHVAARDTTPLATNSSVRTFGRLEAFDGE
jgi:hypothetical protein